MRVDKKCTVCGEVKPLDSFPRRIRDGKTHRDDGYPYVMSKCVPCLAQYRKDLMDTDTARETLRRYRASSERREAARWSNIWQAHKLAKHDFLNLLESQNGQCLICYVSFDVTPPVVDHNHSCCPDRKSCGKCIRGLLCHNCNRALGLVNDDPSVLDNGIAYLHRYATQS